MVMSADSPPLDPSICAEGEIPTNLIRKLFCSNENSDGAVHFQDF